MSRAALEAFRADPARFDVVLSDETMPELTGSELALAVRQLIRADLRCFNRSTRRAILLPSGLRRARRGCVVSANCMSQNKW